MARAIHSMIRVLDEQRSVDFYKRAFELKVCDRFDFESFSLIYLKNDETDFELELTVNKGQKDPYELGNGYGHLAVSVDDIDSEHARLASQGFEPRDIVSFSHDGSPMARFFFVKDPDGYDIEVLQRDGRFR